VTALRATRSPADSPPVVSGGVAPNGWRVLALVEIANFAALRRVLGRFRADALSELVAAEAATACGAIVARAVGRALVEVELIDRDLPALEARLARMEGHFARPVPVDGEVRRLEVVIAGAAAAASWEEVSLVEAAEQALAVAREDKRLVLRDVTSGSPGSAASLCRDLVAAMAADEIVLHYQPKLHVRRQEVASIEALARWNHPQRGLIPPSEFIPLAERSGLIGPLTLLVLRRVIDDQRVLGADGYDLPVFVNIAGQLLADRDFMGEACALIARAGARIACLRDVADQGIPIAIDDYGAGLSSLAYLKQLPACELKIDKMFVLELTSSHRDPLIVRSTIDLAHAMEMEVTAEGVETPAALALLTVMGCDLVQGFLLSRPLSLPDLQRYLASDVKLPVAPSFDLGRRAVRRA
jgi:diguanylate cyclase